MTTIFLPKERLLYTVLFIPKNLDGTTQIVNTSLRKIFKFYYINHIGPDRSDQQVELLYRLKSVLQKVSFQYGIV